MNEGKTSRIAKNTIIVYIRLFVTMIVGLLSSRFVLQALGASDFGLYNVVGGVLAMLGFISSSMTTTTTRFLNFEEGKVNGDTNKVFNTCLVIHVVVALLIFVLAETLGIYYVNNVLNVTPGKEDDALFVFQISTIVACIGLINVPYQGLLIAKESFQTIAIFEIVNSVIKLVLVLSLFYFKDNILRVYAIFMSVSTFVNFCAYHWICNRRWSEIIKFKIVKEKKGFKDILKFNNYTILGAFSLSLRDQGSNMLINFFLGTTVNAAYAIARSIQLYVNAFTANFDVAAGPQITQNYSAGNIQKSYTLVYSSAKICMLLMELILFPLIVELDFILHLWLGKVPDNTLLFSQLILALVFVGSTSAGLTRLISACGKIKWFKIQIAILYILCIPIGYFLLKNNVNPACIIILFIISDSISRINQLVLLHRIIGFDSILFIKKAYVKPFIIAFAMCAYMLVLHAVSHNSIFNIVVTFLVVSTLLLFIGLSAKERNMIYETIFKKILK